ncbi:MAG: hypothetical protein K2X66_17655, partial [Cyanobacteria bacterium]|nr:hypothetical protein [Cyanobacteriota bacterium]
MGSTHGDTFHSTASLQPSIPLETLPVTLEKALNSNDFQNYKPHLFQDKSKYLALFEAIKTKNLSVLEAYRYDPNELPDPRYFFDPAGKTLTHRVFDANDPELFRAFLKTGFPLYVLDAHGNLPQIPHSPILLDFQKAYQQTLEGVDSLTKQQLQIEMKKLLSRVDVEQTNALQKAIYLLKKNFSNPMGEKPVSAQLELDKMALDCTLAIEPLLKMGADPNATGDHQESVLIQAIQKKNLPLVQCLLNYGANPNQFWLQFGFWEDSDGGVTEPAHYTPAKTRLELKTPLSIASGAFDPISLAIIDLLINGGAHFYQGGGFVETPFQGLLLSDGTWQPEKLEDYLQKGASVFSAFRDKNNNVTTPIAAVLNSDLPPQDKQRALKFLLNHGASPNGPANTQETYLHWAVSQRDLEMTNLLLEAGADPNLMPPFCSTSQYPGRYWGTPLLWAAKGEAYKQRQDENAPQQFEWLQRLLKAGASPNLLKIIQNNARQLPLIEVLDSGQDLRMMDLLLDHGANPQLRDPGSRLFDRYKMNDFYGPVGTVLEWAMAMNNVPVIHKLLGERNFDIHTLNPNQFEHLMSKALKMKSEYAHEVLNLLLDLGIDINPKNYLSPLKAFDCPLNAAETDFLKLLMGYGLEIPSKIQPNSQFIRLGYEMRSWIEKDPFLKKAQELTPLQASVWMGNLNRVQSLQKMGASLTENNDKGEKLVLLALEAGRAQVLDYLLAQGCKIENFNFETLPEKHYASIIPIIAKYQDIKAYTVQGARYAAWER